MATFHTYMCVYLSLCIYIYIYTYIHICTYIYMHIYTYTYIYVHIENACGPSWFSICLIDSFVGWIFVIDKCNICFACRQNMSFGFCMLKKTSLFPNSWHSSSKEERTKETQGIKPPSMAAPDPAATWKSLSRFSYENDKFSCRGHFQVGRNFPNQPL